VATATPSQLRQVFDVLRAILAPHAKTLLVTADDGANYRLCSRTLEDRIGRPLFVAAVETNKSSVSYHLMPVYTEPRLTKSLSPALNERLQGKSCFNFRSLDEAQAARHELAQLTRAGIDAFRNIQLPWVTRPSLSAGRRGTAARRRAAPARR